jgi:hypothetical protein
MSSTSADIKKWRDKTKKIIVEAFGGGCGICGYSKCNAALDLHHLDPSTKEFNISRVMARPVSWGKIVKEIRKCVLLCSRCHTEVHMGVAKLPKTIQTFDENFAEINRRNYNFSDICPVCKGPKTHFTITCSKKCGGKRTNKIDWEPHDVKKLYDEMGSFTKVGEHVGCSPFAVKKRLIKLGHIERICKVDWSKVDLNQLINVDKKSLCSIGRDLGVSDNAVRKRAKKMKLIV